MATNDKIENIVDVNIHLTDGASNMQSGSGGGEGVDQGYTPSSDKTGLKANFYNIGGRIYTMPATSHLTPDVSRVDKQLNYVPVDGSWEGLPFENFFASVHTGLIHIATAGTYTFHLDSDDGSNLWMRTIRLIHNGDNHSMRRTSISVALDAGYYPIRIEFYENTGIAGMIFSWTPPNGIEEIVPEAVLSHI